MKLVCHAAFGNFAEGDEVEVSDDVEKFDKSYFHVKEEKAAPKAAEKDGD